MDVTIIDTLIALVEERPTIWDKSVKSHSRRYSVEKCWKEISEALKVDENALRKKWKYLRDQYCVELGKRSSAGSPKWRHFRALEFLRDTVTPRIYGREDEDEGGADDHSSSDYFERISVKENKKMKHEKKKKNRKTSIASAQEYDKSADESIVSNIEKTEEDEHLHFFRSVLPHVRKIHESKVLTFRGRIQSLVEEFAYGIGASGATTEFIPEDLIKGSPPRYSSEACDPIETSE